MTTLNLDIDAATKAHIEKLFADVDRESSARAKFAQSIRPDIPEMLTDEQWDVVRPLLPAISRQYRNSDPRRFINTVLWLARTNRPWTGFDREYMRYRRLRHVWPALFEELADVDPSFPYSYDPGRGIVFTPPTTIPGAESDSTNDFGI